VSVLAGFAIVFIEGIASLYKRFHAINFGIYGARTVGKTTLNHQLRTRGEVPDIKKRTVGAHKVSRKFVKLDGNEHSIKSADIGGESQYWNLWKKDMRKRRVKYIIFLIDDRHLSSTANMQNQLAWQYLIDLICDDYWRDGNKNKKKKEHHFPRAIGLWANKYDLWKDKYEHVGDIKEHPIFEPFKFGMQRLQERGIPTYRYIVSAKSDPEMVYRGVLTMVDDY
jgi:GTPase SAR1 family protein